MGIINGLKSLLGPRTSKHAGYSVIGGGPLLPAMDTEGALRLSAVFGAVKLLSEDVASLPLKVYEGSGAQRREADYLRVYSILHDSPNSYQTAMALREALMASLLLHGNAYAEIERTASGDIAGLHLVDPFRVSLDLDTKLNFKIDGQPFPTQDLFRVSAFSTDGIHGRSVAHQAADSLELSRSVDVYARAYFRTGGAIKGILKYDDYFRDEAARKRLLEDWRRSYGSGPERGHGTVLLERGIDYQSVSSNPENAQLLELRKFQVEEVARWFRIPAAVLGVTDGSSQYKVFKETLDSYVRLSLRPWLVRIEQAINQQLLDPGYHCEHILDAFLRADTETRYRAYETGLNAGFLTVEEIREKENLPPRFTGGLA